MCMFISSFIFFVFFFFFNDTATTEIYTVSDTLSLHDALPIWPLLELLAEIQQHLCQLAGRIQPVCPRSVVPLLVSCQLELQTQILNVQIVSTLLLAVTLGKQRTQHRFQRCAVLRQVGQVLLRGVHTSLDALPHN